MNSERKTRKRYSDKFREEDPLDGFSRTTKWGIKRQGVNLQDQQFEAGESLNLPESSIAADFDEQNTGNTENVQVCTADDQTFQSTLCHHHQAQQTQWMIASGQYCDDVLTQDSPENISSNDDGTAANSADDSGMLNSSHNCDCPEMLHETRESNLSWVWHVCATSYCLSYFSFKIYMKNSHK